MTQPVATNFNLDEPNGAAGNRLARAGMLVALTVAFLVTAACTAGSIPGTTVAPSASPDSSNGATATPSSDPSVEPSAPPSAAPSGSSVVPADLGPDIIGVVVATDGLRVRSLPTVGDESERLEPTLEEGVRLYVVDAPVEADGYAWYQAQPYGTDEQLPFGWIAAGSREGEPWIEQFPLGCDSIAPSAELLVSGEPLEQLFCSGIGENLDITIDGDVWCTLADDHNPVTGPDWISEAGYCALRAGNGSRRVYGEAVHQLLDEANSPVEGRYTITGHFDDPGARECRAFVMEGDTPPDPASVVLLCRTYFVVTEVTPIPA